MSTSSTIASTSSFESEQRESSTFMCSSFLKRLRAPWPSDQGRKWTIHVNRLSAGKKRSLCGTVGKHDPKGVSPSRVNVRTCESSFAEHVGMPGYKEKCSSEPCELHRTHTGYKEVPRKGS